ncbi:hypothetical protein ACA910_021703 [Epithemia clementina (nom. ined.)]
MTPISFNLSLKQSNFVNKCGNSKQTPLMSRPRYGPPTEEHGNDGFFGKDYSASLVEKKGRYLKLLQSIVEAKDPEHIPSLLAKHLDFLLALTQDEVSRLASSIIEDARGEGDDAKASKLDQAIELSIVFVEDFVEQTAIIDKKNKEFLGKILRIVSAKEINAREREDALDSLFVNERENLTAGFLRHVESECDRISKAPKITPESSRLLEILRIIQARVVEELGEDLGEVAQVLGQLIGYETRAERLAVLEAGLTVRGVGFAHELKTLTEEALEGFQKVTKKVDPSLIKIVQELDTKLHEYIDENSEFE